MKGRRLAWVLAFVVLLGACTTGSSTTQPGGSSAGSTGSSTGSASGATGPTTSPGSGATLASGEPVPSTCAAHRPSPDQTVSFAIQGKVWAFDPSSGRLSCVLEGVAPGPFLWGPRGDRLLLDGFQLAGFGKAPSATVDAPTPTIADWGHPIGIAVVFAEAGATQLQKFLFQGRQVETLRDLPHATYLDVAYHPSGLALAMILERNGSQSIWFSTNEGKDPKRLVFTKEGTTFSDVTFTHDGRSLVYLAHHTAGYSELHTIRLSRPDKLHSVWKGPVGEDVESVSLSPDDRFYAATEGTACADHRAVLLNTADDTSTPALQREKRPTTVQGWIDDHTYLVEAGGCGSPADVYAVDTDPTVAPVLLVSGVDAAASRAPAPSAPKTLPKEVTLDTGSGVG